MIKNTRMVAALVLALICLLAAPAQGWAAYLELSATAKKALDATAAKADRATAGRIGKLYADFLASQKEEQRLDASIKALSAANTAAESAVRRDIREIDAAKLQQLALQVKQTKARYQPLFDRYTALNKQIAAVRALKSPELNKLLRMQADLMKIAVQAARQEIRGKEDALRAAKAEASRKIKELRGALEATATAEAQIKKAKQAAAAANKKKSPAWKTLNDHARKGKAAGAAATLSDLLAYSNQIVANKREVQQAEVRIADLIRGVKQRAARS